MSPRRIERSIDVAIALIVVSVAVALAGLTWRLAGDPGRRSRNVAPAPAAPTPLDLSPILAFAPFGRASPIAASPTSLGLQLRATLLAAPRSASAALISTAGGPAQSVTIGQTIVGGAIVDAIELDHVLLRVGGRTELLGFPRPDGSPGPVAPAGDRPATYAVAPAPVPTATASRAFLDSLGLTITDGGYRIGPNPSAAARLAGLLPGDLIEKVNGSVAGDVDKDGQALDAAVRSGGGRLEIMRNGRRMTLSFPAR